MNSMDLAAMQRAFDSMNPVLRQVIRAVSVFGEAIRKVIRGLRPLIQMVRRTARAIARAGTAAELPAHSTAQQVPFIPWAQPASSRPGLRAAPFVTSRYVETPMFELVSNPSINLQEVKNRRFSVHTEEEARARMVRVLNERSKHIPKTIWERL